MRCKFRRRGQKVNAEGELMEERREVIGGGRGGKKHHKHGESNSNLTSYERTNKKMLLGKKCSFLYLVNLLYPTGPQYKVMLCNHSNTVISMLYSTHCYTLYYHDITSALCFLRV